MTRDDDVSAAGHSTARRRRRALALAIPVIVVVGLTARFALPGGLADVSGGVFYTALVYALIGFALPTAGPAQIGASALAFSAAIEGFQATGVPADLADTWSPIRLVLGSSFVATDFLAYAAGAALAVACDRAWSGRGSRPASEAG